MRLRHSNCVSRESRPVSAAASVAARTATLMVEAAEKMRSANRAVHACPACRLGRGRFVAILLQPDLAWSELLADDVDNPPAETVDSIVDPGGMHAIGQQRNRRLILPIHGDARAGEPRMTPDRCG